MHAQGAGDFALYVLRCLSWPISCWPWLCIVVWLPWIALGVSATQRKLAAQDARAELILAAGFWVLLQVLAVAYARGAGASLPSPRYCDVLAVGVICNLLAFSAWNRPSTARLRRIVMAIWVALILGGFLYSALPVWREELPAVASRNREYERNVRGYVLTGEPGFIKTGAVPFPDRDWLRQVLDRPAIRAVLPPSVRAPLKLTADPGHVQGIREGDRSPATPPLDGRMQWGSYHAAKPALWRSMPVTVHPFRFWRFEMAGQPGAEGLALQLATPDGTPLTSRIMPSREPDDSWHSAYVGIPPSTDGVIVQAKDTSPDKWLAFSDPVEVSALSQWARRFSLQAPVILGGGIFLLLLSSVMVIWPRLIQPASQNIGDGGIGSVTVQPSGDAGTTQ
jgi:hypothetical protein